MFPHCRYTKYLYPVECKNNSFSNPNDLQSAIEGNKREGRTSSFGPYGGMPMQHSPLPPSLGGGMHMMGMMGTPPRPMQINGNRPPMHPGNADPLSLSTPSCPMSSSLLSLSQWWISPGQGRDVNIPTLRDLNQWDDETSILRPHHHGGRKLQPSEWQPMVTRHGWSLQSITQPAEIDWNVPNQWTILVKSRRETREIVAHCHYHDNFSQSISSHDLIISNLTDWRLDESKSLWLWLALDI